MQQNSYFRSIVGRRNLVKEAVLDFFKSISSYPRLVMEVFLRREMGRRYFTLSSAIVVAVILLLFPSLLPSSFHLPLMDILLHYALWYVFVAAYCFFAYKRYMEIKRRPSKLDFGHFTKNDGKIHPRFLAINKKPRTIEIWLEPIPFLAAGLLLWMLGQSVLGGLFIVCAVIYSLSKSAAYAEGDNYMMDLNDEQEVNKAVRSIFSGEKYEGDYKFKHDIPDRQEDRNALLDAMFGKDVY